MLKQFSLNWLMLINPSLIMWCSWKCINRSIRSSSQQLQCCTQLQVSQSASLWLHKRVRHTGLNSQRLLVLSSLLLEFCPLSSIVLASISMKFSALLDMESGVVLWSVKYIASCVCAVIYLVTVSQTAFHLVFWWCADVIVYQHYCLLAVQSRSASWCVL